MYKLKVIVEYDNIIETQYMGYGSKLKMQLAKYTLLTKGIKQLKKQGKIPKECIVRVEIVGPSND